MTAPGKPLCTGTDKIIPEFRTSGRLHVSVVRNQRYHLAEEGILLALVLSPRAAVEASSGAREHCPDWALQTPRPTPSQKNATHA